MIIDVYWWLFMYNIPYCYSYWLIFLDGDSDFSSMHAISGQGSVLPLFFNDMAGVCLYNGHRIIDFTQLSDPPFSGNVQQALATHLCSSHHCRQSWPSAPVDTPPSSILPLNKSTCTQCISLYTATAPITSHCPFRGWALNCALSTSLCSSLHRCHQHLNDSYSYRDA